MSKRRRFKTEPEIIPGLAEALAKVADHRLHGVGDVPGSLVPFGYAPGGYVCTCRESDCETLDFVRPPRKRLFMGDKRAWRCKPCAEKVKATHDLEKAQGQRRLRQAIDELLGPLPD